MAKGKKRRTSRVLEEFLEEFLGTFKSSRGSGIPVDSSGGPTFDPTANVKDLSIASNKRQDDLREASERYNASSIGNLQALNVLHITYLKEIGAIREHYEQRISSAEADRLNSIRQIDREEVNKTATQAQLAITTLANQTTALAETLRNQVATTANAATQQRAIDNAEANKRISALELSSSAGKGKETGVSASQQLLIAVFGLILLALTAYGALKPVAPIIIPAANSSQK
jgi:hypothetical protein